MPMNMSVKELLSDTMGVWTVMSIQLSSSRFHQVQCHSRIGKALKLCDSHNFNLVPNAPTKKGQHHKLPNTGLVLAYLAAYPLSYRESMFRLVRHADCYSTVLDSISNSGKVTIHLSVGQMITLHAARF